MNDKRYTPEEIEQRADDSRLPPRIVGMLLQGAEAVRRVESLLALAQARCGQWHVCKDGTIRQWSTLLCSNCMGVQGENFNPLDRVMWADHAREMLRNAAGELRIMGCYRHDNEPVRIQGPARACHRVAGEIEALLATSYPTTEKQT